MNRKPLSVKLRFEVFKRDNFTCRYCGKTPENQIILHVDHIVPVSKGGGNELMNLATSCNDCNSGKGNRLIESLSSEESVSGVNKEMRKEIAKRKEIEKQLKEYYKQKTTISKYNPLYKFLNDTLESEFGFTLTETGMKGFSKLYQKLSLDDLIEAIEITKNKFNIRVKINNNQASEIIFRYLCGILHNKVKEKNDPIYSLEREIKFYYLRHPNKKGSDFYREWQIRPYIESLGPDVVRDAIDSVFNGQRPKSGYFSSVIHILGEQE